MNHGTIPLDLSGFVANYPDRVIQRIGDSAPNIFEELRDARIFISGGSGFIGRWLIKTLLLAELKWGLNLSVVVLTRDRKFAEAALWPDVKNVALTLVYGDVRDFKFPEGDFSHVLHLAAVTASATFRGADPLEQFDIAFCGTRRVLDFASSRGALRFLMTSTGSVYGANHGEDRIPETCLAAPLTHTLSAAPEHGKRAAEFLAAYYQDRRALETVIARCFTFIGPGLPLDIHYAVGNFIRDALWCDELTVRGDGSPQRSYMDVSDLIVWLLKMLVFAPSGTVYNVGSDQAITIRDLAVRVRDLLAPEKPVRILGAPGADANRNVYVPDISRARRELGLDVWTDLDSAIRATAQFALQAQKISG